MATFFFITSLLLLLLICALLERMRTKYRIGPMTVLIGMLAITPAVFFMPYVTIMKEPPSGFAQLWYFFGVLSILLGYSVPMQKIVPKPLLPLKAYRILLYFCIIFACIAMAVAIYDLIRFGFFSADISGEEAYAASANRGQEEGGTLIFAFASLTGSFRQISGFALIIMLGFFRGRLGQVVFAVGCVVAVGWIVLQAASLSRGALIWPILTVVVMALNSSRSIPWLKIGRWISLGFVILIVLTLSRHRADDFYGRSYSHRGVEVSLPFWSQNLVTWITETAIYYQGHPFGNFGAIIDNRYDFRPSLGHESVRGSSFLFRFFAPRSLYNTMAINAQRNREARIAHGLYKQWSTWFGSLYQSFGLVGIPVLSFLTGFLFSRIQRFAIMEGRAVERIFFAALTLIAFSSASIYFMGSIGGFGLTLFCFLMYVYLKFARKRFGVY